MTIWLAWCQLKHRKEKNEAQTTQGIRAPRQGKARIGNSDEEGRQVLRDTAGQGGGRNRGSR